MRLLAEPSLCCAEENAVAPYDAVTVTHSAVYLISVIGTSAKWITCVATEPKSRP